MSKVKFFDRADGNVPVKSQSRSQSFVPLDQRSENESSGSNHYERTKEITEFWLSGSLRICIYGACLKWFLPELSFSDRWSRGTKLWERDWSNRSLNILPPPPGIPRAFDVFSCPRGREFDELSLPGGGAFDHYSLALILNHGRDKS